MLGIDQPVRPTGVEAQHPIVNRLQTNAPIPSRLTARAPFINLGHSQMPPQLTGITRALRQSAKLGTVKILAKSNRRCHGKPPSRLPS
jgi:hypothetical protein